MPWRRRYNYTRYRRRYRWPRRWRFRKTFPYRRRRYRWVRKRKAKKITVKQFQPSKIRLTKIKGLLCLFLCNAKRLCQNLAIYNQLIVPEKLPGGGGTSIYVFSLDNLYTMHTYGRNWWTQSNRDLPLVRYLKCTIKIMQSEDVDIVFRYHINQPMDTGKLSYPTTQPSVLMMLKHSILIPSKKTKLLKKDTKKLPLNHLI